MRNKDIRHKIGIHGLKRTFVFNNLLVTLIAVLVGIILFTFFTRSYLYSSVQTGLVTKANTATNFFANYRSNSYSEFYDSAYNFVNDFEDANKLELQFVNTGGRVIISSYGITAGSSPETQDIFDAVETKDIAVWVGNAPGTGERIMAVSAPIIYSENRIVGIMRYVTSIENADNQVMLNIFAAVGVGIALLLIILLLNLL